MSNIQVQNSDRQAARKQTDKNIDGETRIEIKRKLSHAYGRNYGIHPVREDEDYRLTKSTEDIVNAAVFRGLCSLNLLPGAAL